ncbi:MAG: hypothetical protein WBC70_13310 [Candidatus Aminicenantales bacterium]
MIFSTCRKCSKTTSKVGNYTNMYLSGILDPEEFDKKYGMMCGDHAGEMTKIILSEKNLSRKDFAEAHRKALMVMDQELLGDEERWKKQK